MNPRATFVKRFGDLVALLRTDPGNDAAQELALTAATAAVEREAVVVESGFERGLSAGEDLTLEGRLRARRIDLVRISAGAGPEELLSLARALSHDRTAVSSTARVQVKQLPELPACDRLDQAEADHFTPPRVLEDRRRWRERRRWRAERWRGPDRRQDSDRRRTGERRARLARLHRAAAARLRERLARAVTASAWADALDTAHALLECVPLLPNAERRSFALGVRQALPRRALGGLIDVALRDPAERERAAAVLCWTGLEGADAMVDVVRASETVGSRRFLHDALSTMPEAFPCVVPLLNSPEAHEVRHAAAILGGMGRAEAIEPLKARLAHGDADVRAAVLRALAEFPARDVAEALRAGLAHPSAATRAAAAQAIAAGRPAALAMPLVAALETESDGAAWSAMVRALGALASTEACAGLLSVALARRRLLGGGYATERRVEAVRALATVAAPCRTAALTRLVQEGDEPVRQAAAAALGRGEAVRRES